MIFQKTIKSSIHTSGLGLHTNKEIEVTLSPLTANCGIWFRRSDLPQAKAVIAASQNVSGTTLATTLGSGLESISTIEHLMAALGGLGIDNILIDVSGPEMPIMDGSAAPWVNLLQSAGLLTLERSKSFYKVLKPFKLEMGDKFIKVEPASQFSIEGTIDFGGLIGCQKRHLIMTAKTFAKELAPARTFCLLKDVELMKQNGLALGGSLENAVVVGDDGILNPEGLRFQDEFVRHKMLDFVGDIALSQAPIIGHFTLMKPGHDLNQRFLAEALKTPGVLELASFPGRQLRQKDESFEQLPATALMAAN